MSQPKVVLVSSRKGGTGKSTVCGHIAVFGGPAAALIDADPQAGEGSSGTWIAARKEESPRFFSHDDYVTHGIDYLLDAAKEAGASHIIIDTPPVADASVTAIMRLADVNIVVTEPSYLPLRALPRSLSIANAVGKPVVVVLNKVKEQRAEAAQTREAFIKNKLTFVELNDLAEFARAFAEGKAVHEFAPRSKAAQQIAVLWSTVKGVM